MKRVYDNIEQQYKNRFDTYEHDFNQAAMWQSLDAALPTSTTGLQYKSTAYAFVGMLLVGLIASTFWMNQEVEQTAVITDVLQKEQAISVDKPSEKATQTVITSIESDENTAYFNESTASMQNSHSAITAATLKQEKPTQLVNASLPKPNHSLLAHTNNTLAESASILPTTQKRAKTSSIEGRQKATTPIASTSNNTTLKYGTITSLQKNVETKLQSKMSLLPTVSAQSIATPSLLQKEATLRDGDMGCPFGPRSPMQINGRVFVDVYGEADYNFTTIESQNTETNAYEQTWNDTDTPLGSYEIGAMLGYEFDGGLYIGAGLEYQKTVEKLEYQQTVIERITVWSDEAYFYLDENGNQVFVGDSVTTQSTYQRSVVSGKEHTLLNLPILLGYNMHKNRWNIGLFGGANINLSHKFEGKIIDETNSFVTLDENNYETVYKKKLGVSAFAGIHFGNMITNNMELYFNPTFRFHPKTWMQEDYALSAKYKLAGLRLGLRYKL